MSVTNEEWTIRLEPEVSKKQLDAAANVLCDATGWPLKDCRYTARLMFEEAEKARHR